jgi:signal transduction histidine kinase
MLLPMKRSMYPSPHSSSGPTDVPLADERDRRRLVLVDGMLALAIGVVTVAPSLVYPTTVAVDDISELGDDVDAGLAAMAALEATSRWAMVAVVALVVAPLAFRRIAPWSSFIGVLLASLATSAPAVMDLVQGSALYLGGMNLPLLVAVFSVANLIDRRKAAIVGTIGAAALIVTLYLPVGFADVTTSTWLTVFDLAVYAVMPTVLVVIVAQVLRDQRGRADAAQREAAMAMVHAELRVAAAASAERRRLASELHDIVAHHVNLMVVQSEKGPYLRDQEASNRTYATIAETGRAALGELDRLLGVLRTDGSGSVGAPTTSPLPTHHEVPALVEAARRAGVAVELCAFDVPAIVDPAISATIHRIVQECITNVVKHGDHRQPASVDVVTRNSGIVITVGNVGKVSDASETKAADPSGERRGHGLESMRSRVEAFGGTLHAGHRGGRFQVEAMIPLSHRGGERISSVPAAGSAVTA